MKSIDDTIFYLSTFENVNTDEILYLKTISLFSSLGLKLNHIHRLITPYFDKNRFYHNSRHIVYCLSELYRIVHLVSNFKAFELALIAHDSVYETNEAKLDNEAKSFNLLTSVLFDSGFDIKRDASILDYIHNLTMATSHKSELKGKDEQLIADIDLSIFGQSEELLDQYGRNIRKEFSHISEKLYCDGRKKLLSSFLEKDHIYYTDHFRLLYEDKARENLTREISKIEKNEAIDRALKSIDCNDFHE